MKLAKRHYYNKFINDIKTSNPHQWYSKLKRITAYDQHITNEINVDEISHLSDQKQADFLANKFSSVSQEYDKLKKEDISLFIPHQANLRIAQFIQRKFQFSDKQVFNNINKYGNTTAASIPIALTEAYQKKLIKKGDLVLLAAFGSGFTWGSALIRW